MSEGDDRVPDWEMGLPSDEDLASLSYSLIPPNLAMAFSITPENIRTIQDVNLASETTLSSLRSGSSCPNTSSSEEEEDRVGSSSPGSDPKKQKKTSDDDDGVVEEGDSGIEKTLKRQRLVWTPQLHKRFVDVVARLGIKNAVPKTIMQLMNVEGLSRENVASHLQKYRLYLNRLTTEGGGGPSSSDNLFSSTMMQMPVYGHHMGMQGYHHQNHNGTANAYMMQQNKFGSMASYPPVGGGSANEN